VKISTNWFLVSTKINSISFLLTWSLIKWCLISICFDLECWIGFFDKFIALVLSHNIGIFLYLIEKSSSWFLIHNTWEQQFDADTYSASVVDRAIVFCFLHNQLISAFPRNWRVPLVLFLFNFVSGIISITVCCQIKTRPRSRSAPQYAIPKAKISSTY